MHVKGYAAEQTKAAAEQARLLIEQAEALGEPPEDPLLLFSVLYAFWVGNYVAFNGDAMRDFATQFLGLAEKQRATGPLMIGHRLMGSSLLLTGDIAAGRGHLDQAIALYDPAEHRPLATRFGQDVGVMIFAIRAWDLWLLGYPDAALGDADRSLRDAREIGQAATLMHALLYASVTHMFCGDYTVANKETDQLFALADEKTAAFLEGESNFEQREPVGRDRKTRRCCSNDRLRSGRISVNGSNSVAARAPIRPRRCLRGASPI